MYREENGQVVLTMTRTDYDRLNAAFAMASCWLMYQTEKPCRHSCSLAREMFAAFNRLNEGNPTYTPHRIEDTKTPQSG